MSDLLKRGRVPIKSSLRTNKSTLVPLLPYLTLSMCCNFGPVAPQSSHPDKPYLAERPFNLNSKISNAPFRKKRKNMADKKEKKSFLCCKKREGKGGEGRSEKAHFSMKAFVSVCLLTSTFIRSLHIRFHLEFILLPESLPDELCFNVRRYFKARTLFFFDKKLPIKCLLD